MSSRYSSGSSRSAIAVEPTRSQKRTVTCLRSPSSGTAGVDGSALGCVAGAGWLRAARAGGSVGTAGNDPPTSGLDNPQHATLRTKPELRVERPATVAATLRRSRPHMGQNGFRRSARHRALWLHAGDAAASKVNAALLQRIELAS
jgi:hypothetical protein